MERRRKRGQQITNQETHEFWLKYITIPIEVFANKNLTKTEMFLFAIIELLDNQKGCYATSFLREIMKADSIRSY